MLSEGERAAERGWQDSPKSVPSRSTRPQPHFERRTTPNTAKPMTLTRIPSKPARLARWLTLSAFCAALLSSCYSLKPGGDVSDRSADSGTDGGPRDGGPSDGGQSDGGPSDGGPSDGGPRDGGPRDGGDSGPLDAGCPPTSRDLDLLFMVDNSGSMSEEQASLATELPRLVSVLMTGDRTGDGPTGDDFEPFATLHVGVVTSDMGVAGYVVPTCTRAPLLGDDGVLRTTGNTLIAGCVATYPKFLAYEPGVSIETPEQFGEGFRCVAVAGISGCGFEQQLEAALKALTPSTSAIRFFMGMSGHGDTENAGFLRPNSLVAVVLVTDEEDCSVRAGSEDIFNSTSATYTGDLNLRCFNYSDARYPVERYIDGLRALRTGRESLVVFSAIVGVPVELVPTGTPDYDAILSDPRMVEMLDTTMPSRLIPSCNVVGRGVAFPPRRIVEVARGFGDNGTVQSICQANFSGALDAIIAKLSAASGTGVCMP